MGIAVGILSLCALELEIPGANYPHPPAAQLPAYVPKNCCWDKG